MGDDYWIDSQFLIACSCGFCRNIKSQLTHTGDLNRVTRIVNVMGLANSTLPYTEQHLVADGASELLVEVFGERRRHARSAFGVAQIWPGACVEIELIAEIA